MEELPYCIDTGHMEKYHRFIRASEPVPAVILVQIPGGEEGELRGYVTAWTKDEMKVAVPWPHTENGWLEFWTERRYVRKPDDRPLRLE